VITQNPKIPVIIAITKNKRVHDNICINSRSFSSESC
jgi:ribosomal protein L39E